MMKRNKLQARRNNARVKSFVMYCKEINFEEGTTNNTRILDISRFDSLTVVFDIN